MQMIKLAYLLPLFLQRAKNFNVSEITIYDESSFLRRLT